MFGGFLGWYTIYTFLGLLPPNGILPGAKFTLPPGLAYYELIPPSNRVPSQAGTGLKLLDIGGHDHKITGIS